MKRLVFWAAVLAVLAFYGGGPLVSRAGALLQGRADERMGGACRAFMEGGQLEEEYLFNCSDEVVALLKADNVTPRYEIAEGILFEAVPDMADDKRKLPSPRQLRVALMAQWGGACDFLLGNAAPLPAEQDVKAAVRMRACLIELKRLRPKAWRALVERHFQLWDEAAWTEDYFPTHEQLRRALDEEDRFLGFTSRELAGGGALLIAVLGLVDNRESILAALAGMGRRVTRRRPKAATDREAPAGGARAKANASEPESFYWRMADSEFKQWFDSQFHPLRGRYATSTLRSRIYEAFIGAVDRQHLQSKKRLVTQVRVQFHPDKAADGRFSAAELTAISQQINGTLPRWKDA